MAMQVYTGPVVVLPPFDSIWTHASLGQTEEVRRHLLQGADMEQFQGPGRSTALMQSVIGGHAPVVLLLLEHRADVMGKNLAGTSSLHFAAMFADGVVGIEVAKLLLDKGGADVSAKDDKGDTALHYAARTGNATAVPLLLQRGAQVQSRSDQGSTPEDLATAGTTTERRLLVVALLKAEAVRISKCEAFAMGHQERLGVGSRVLELDAGVVRIVLDHV